MGRRARIVKDWDKGSQMLIKTQRPFGIIVISADPGVKNKFVYGMLERAISMVCVTTMGCTEEKLKECLKNPGVICVSLTAEESCSLATRRNMIDMLRQAGVKKVYGVHLTEARRIYPEVDAAAAALEANPPTSEDLDRLIVITDSII